MASALAGPTASSEVSAVLDFWFGPERGSLLSDPQYVGAWSRVWFGGQRTTEQLRAFEPLICRAAEGSLSEACWETSAGLLARIILLDQLARELWRGTRRALLFDAPACRLAERLLADGLGCWETAEAMFVVMPLMHSEALADHGRLCAVLAEDNDDRRKRGLAPRLEATAAFAEGHRVVVERFGRYPHRNALLGRVGTPEEQRWLSEEAPGWARSQQPVGGRAEPSLPPLAGPADSDRAVRLIALDCTSALFERPDPGADVLPFFQWAARLGYVAACVLQASEVRRDHLSRTAVLSPMIHFWIVSQAEGGDEHGAALRSLLQQGRGLLPDLGPQQILHVKDRRPDGAEGASSKSFHAALVGNPLVAPADVAIASFDDVRLRLESRGGLWECEGEGESP
eukprot:CAMPEP_0171180080 /NCGR_PEP_ID=MMETSP0790-20130122/13577_1 /TAXON_ID=2925 /ORGANISM="Alexandrium catenella, Strain OF101" /LENGTH=398 /DNA_ID=CAMNT_0011645011 /DNA_START=58 /DNA_END=1254 /DNA_ORIENTATION=+